MTWLRYVSCFLFTFGRHKYGVIPSTVGAYRCRRCKWISISDDEVSWWDAYDAYMWRR